MQTCLQESTCQHKKKDGNGKNNVDGHPRLARRHEQSDVIFLVLDAVPCWNFDYDTFVRPERNGERTVCTVDATLRFRNVGILIGWFVDVEYRMDVILDVVVVTVEDVVVITIGGDFMLRRHVQATFQILHIVAQIARRETLGQQYIAIVTGQQTVLEARYRVRRVVGIVHGIASVVYFPVVNGITLCPVMLSLRRRDFLNRLTYLIAMPVLTVVSSPTLLLDFILLVWPRTDRFLGLGASVTLTHLIISRGTRRRRLCRSARFVLSRV